MDKLFYKKYKGIRLPTIPKIQPSEIQIERESLAIRNFFSRLDIFVRDGYIEYDNPTEDGELKTFHLTERGKQKIKNIEMELNIHGGDYYFSTDFEIQCCEEMIFRISQRLSLFNIDYNFLGIDNRFMIDAFEQMIALFCNTGNYLNLLPSKEEPTATLDDLLGQ